MSGARDGEDRAAALRSEAEEQASRPQPAERSGKRSGARDGEDRAAALRSKAEEQASRPQPAERSGKGTGDPAFELTGTSGLSYVALYAALMVLVVSFAPWWLTLLLVAMGALLLSVPLLLLPVLSDPLDPPLPRLPATLRWTEDRLVWTRRLLGAEWTWEWTLDAGTRVAAVGRSLVVAGTRIPTPDATTAAALASRIKAGRAVPVTARPPLALPVRADHDGETLVLAPLDLELPRLFLALGLGYFGVLGVLLGVLGSVALVPVGITVLELPVALVAAALLLSRMPVRPVRTLRLTADRLSVDGRVWSLTELRWLGRRGDQVLLVTDGAEIQLPMPDPAVAAAVLAWLSDARDRARALPEVPSALAQLVHVAQKRPG